jgi:geranylgeranyl pyrophosphate synthase
MHRKYGLPTAINVGDYMIGLGYRLVSRHTGELGADCAADIMDCLANAHTRLAEGQGAELLWRDRGDRVLSPLDALKIYALKTSPAFEAALLTGARLAGPTDALQAPLRAYARNIGVAFQILNDLGDWDGDDHNKLAAGGDVLGGRPTLLWALALNSLEATQRKELLDLADSKDVDAAEKIRRVRRLYETAGAFEQARRLVDKHEGRALEAAAEIESPAMQRLLMYLVDTVLERSEPVSPAIVSVSNVGNLPIVAAN